MEYMYSSSLKSIDFRRVTYLPGQIRRTVNFAGRFADPAHSVRSHLGSVGTSGTSDCAAKGACPPTPPQPARHVMHWRRRGLHACVRHACTSGACLPCPATHVGHGRACAGVRMHMRARQGSATAAACWTCMKQVGGNPAACVGRAWGQRPACAWVACVAGARQAGPAHACLRVLAPARACCKQVGVHATCGRARHVRGLGVRSSHCERVSTVLGEVYHAIAAANCASKLVYCSNLRFTVPLRRFTAANCDLLRPYCGLLQWGRVIALSQSKCKGNRILLQ